ncbi:hypothetical protein, partial [uncultured Gammaproteobacteria bacterium]
EKNNINWLIIACLSSTSRNAD